MITGTIIGPLWPLEVFPLIFFACPWVISSYACIDLYLSETLSDTSEFGFTLSLFSLILPSILKTLAYPSWAPSYTSWTQRDPWALSRLLLTLLPKTSLLLVRLGNHRGHLIHFSSLRESYSSLPDVLKLVVSYILSWFFCCSSEKGKSTSCYSLFLGNKNHLVT